MRANDDDIKIFHPQKKEGTVSEFADLAAIMDEQRANGNSVKAAILGERFASLTPEELCPGDAAKLENSELTQLRALMVFSAQLAFHKYLPHTILSTQAVNAMYSKTEQDAPGFYSVISDGTSFSFYYLTERKNVNVEREIGRNYAMLCDRDDDEYMINLGSRIYSETEAKVMTLIEEFEFIGA